MNKTKSILIAAAACAASSLQAAMPISIGAGWSETDQTPPAFFWDGLGADNTGGAYTFNAAFPVMLSITDAGLAGDQFNVFDNGVQIGSTPDTGAPDPFSADVENPDAAFADASFSHGVFTLGAGNHAITIQATGDSLEAGKGYLRVDAVPDGGASAAMLAFCAAGVLWQRRQARS
jgi:hypothetical protein